MFRNRSVALGMVLATWLAGCGGGGEPPQPTGKIPVTSASAEARQAFLDGRELLENLRATDARERFLEAVALDPEFAWAQLGVAQTSPTAREFFSALSRAARLAGRASEGERLMIEAFEAGVNGEPLRQRSLLQALVAAYPEDERAQNLMGLYHFGRQEWAEAVTFLGKATVINPAFAPAYNQLGYARRFMGDDVAAEQAFKKYIDLIPDEPNPYDSYAELLMKLGRFGESIEQYQRALEKDPNFIASYVGIGNNRIFMGEFAQARQAFAQLEAAARTDGERRQAATWIAYSYLHQGDFASALAEIDRRYEIAASVEDRGSMAVDLNTMGDILLAAGRADEALRRYQESITMSDASSATGEVKEAVRRNHVADRCRVDLARGDLAAAEAAAAQYLEQVAVHQLPFEVWQTHELAGLIAMARQDYETALAELGRANQQDARVLLATAQALWGKGDDAAAREMCSRAAHFNTLNQAPQSYALIRAEALRLLEQ